MKRNMTLKRLIIFLIRWKLKLKRCEKFKFKNQKTDAVYWFTATKVLKCEHGIITRSGVSLNWLLNDNCEIERVHINNN
jgi:hypothetical protein